MSIELLGGKILSPYFGNSIFVWGAVICVFMLSLSIGYLKGGKYSQHHASLRYLGKIIIASALCTFPIALFGNLFLSWFSFILQDPRYGSLLGASVLFSFPVGIAGMITPYAIRLEIKHLETSGKSAGLLYFISTFGSAVGTIFTSFYAVLWFEIQTIIIGLSLVSLLIGSFLFFAYAPSTQLASNRRKYYLVFSLIVFISASAFFLENSLGKNIIHAEKSLYEDILVVDKNNIRCIYPRSAKFQHSCVDQNTPEKLFHEYTKWMLAALFLNPNPQHILIVGLGAGILPNTFHRFYPQAKIEIVEIDPAMLNVAKQFFDFNEAMPNVHITISDGRQFIRNAQRQGTHYDLIILDAFSHSYIPEHMLTKEFLNEVKSTLSPEGIVASNTFSKGKLLPYESVTYQHVFGQYYNITQKNEGNRIIIAAARSLPDSKKINRQAFVLQDKFKSVGVDAMYLSTLLQLASMTTGVPALTDRFSPANILNVLQ
ncbi:MAG: fused MFS/spermidine synthase [Pseudomonadota bacterium]